jgi:2-keto-4-pentenoate hydratase
VSAKLSDALVAARRHHAQLRASEWPASPADAAVAYAVQDEVARAMGWFNDGPPRTWKSGGPSRDAPLTHAPLPPADVRTSPASFDDMRFHAPGIEAEVALSLREDVTPARAAALRHDEVDDALIDGMMVSIEVVDSRWLEPGATPALLRLADQQSHGALALGPAVAYTRRDWSRQTCVVTIGAQAPVVRTGTHSLGDPAWLLPTWLQHATRHGDTVPAGTIVTTGTWAGVLPVHAGDEVAVEFDGIGRATLRLG